jgi:hypothetical protein
MFARDKNKLIVNKIYECLYFCRPGQTIRNSRCWHGWGGTSGGNTKLNNFFSFFVVLVFELRASYLPFEPHF